MSFILDALKKSAKERQLLENPHLNVIHDYSSSLKKTSSRNRWRRYLLFFTGLLLCTLGILSLFFWFKKYPQDKKLPITLPVTQQTTAPSPPLQHRQTIVKEKEKVLYKHSLEIISPQLPVHSQAKKQGELPLLAYKDLPEKTKENIPQLHFAGHTYSKNPSQRLIIINNKILREGEKVDDNLWLVEITWEGVVLDFKGIKFSKNTP